MADTNPNTPTPTPTPEPEKTKAKAPRSDVNKAWLDEISTTEKLATTAAKPDYAPKLAKRKIDAEWQTTIAAKIEAARKQVSKATGKTTSKKVITKAEQKLRDALIAQIQSIQSAAKQKYYSKDKTALADYYHGKKVEGLSRSDLETCATTIGERAAEADLPGIGADELKALTDALDAYTGVETDQSGEQSEASQARTALELLVKEIADSRRELQFAVDGLWPAGKPENAAIRVEFKLPADRAYKG